MVLLFIYSDVVLFLHLCRGDTLNAVMIMEHSRVPAYAGNPKNIIGPVLVVSFIFLRKYADLCFCFLILEILFDTANLIFYILPCRLPLALIYFFLAFLVF